jgi:hypothetical protein
MDLEQFEQKIYSQNGEDGITLALIDSIYKGSPAPKFFVEIGVESGIECNTRIVRDNPSWSGILLDGSYENASIGLHKEFVTMENVVGLFKKYSVPQHINLLSIDIDSNDFYCLKEILQNYKSDIIICEYNGSHLVHEDKVIIYNSKFCWDGTNYYGASLYAFYKLATKYNYTLVYCNKNGVNCFFVHNDVIAAHNLLFKNMGEIEKIYRPAAYSYGPNGGHRADPAQREYITCEEAISNN